MAQDKEVLIEQEMSCNCKNALHCIKSNRFEFCSNQAIDLCIPLEILAKAKKTNG